MDASIAYHQFFALRDALDGGILLQRNHEEIAVLREELWCAIAKINSSRSDDVYPYFFVEDHDLEPMLTECRMAQVEMLAKALGREQCLKRSPFAQASFHFSGQNSFLGYHIAQQLGLVIIKQNRYRLITDRFAIDAMPDSKPAFYCDPDQLLR